MAVRDRFFGKTFFDFVHPEEAVFARQDLSNFMHAHTLGGSVTRYNALYQFRNLTFTRLVLADDFFLDLVVG